MSKEIEKALKLLAELTVNKNNKQSAGLSADEEVLAISQWKWNAITINSADDCPKIKRDIVAWHNKFVSFV